MLLEKSFRPRVKEKNPMGESDRGWKRMEKN